MGITVYLEDENGNKLSDPVVDIHNVLHKKLPNNSDKKFHYLNKIDWYGDTVFNTNQIEDFLSELHIIEAQLSDQNQKELFNKIKDLALRCQHTFHSYLKFYGD